jgi:hypothetical protein
LGNEGPRVTGDNFLAMMEKAALLHVPAGKVVQSESAPPHFSHRVRVFLDREFPDRLIVRGVPFPGALVFHISLLCFFFFGSL